MKVNRNFLSPFLMAATLTTGSLVAAGTEATPAQELRQAQIDHCASNIMRATMVGSRDKMTIEEQVVGSDNSVNIIDTLAALANQQCEQDPNAINVYEISPLDCVTVSVNGLTRAAGEIYIFGFDKSGATKLEGSESLGSASIGNPDCFLHD